MNYPWTRHMQRYEYVMQKGYVTNRTVADVGAGMAKGSSLLTSKAKLVYAIDPILAQIGKHLMHVPSTAHMDRFKVAPHEFSFFKEKVDICVAIEIFEHMINPEVFISELSEAGEYLFITTPKVARTHETKNVSHVKEYSRKDFFDIVKTKFKVITSMDQGADLTWNKMMKPNGTSLNEGHVVQTIYGRRK